MKNVGEPSVLNIANKSNLALCQYAIVPLILFDKSLRSLAVNRCASSCDELSDDCLLNPEQSCTSVST